MAVYKNYKNNTFYFYVTYTDRYGVERIKKGENKAWTRKKYAKDAEDAFLASIEAEENSGITYGELYELYRKHKKKTVKKRSYYDIETYHKNHILPYFENKNVSSINKRTIKIWQDDLLDKKYSKGDQQIPYSNKMLENIQTYFKMVLNFGIDYEYINKNPFTIDFVKRPEIKKEMDYWKIEEFNKFMEHVPTLEYKTMFRLLYFGGLRKGELLALQVGDFNSDEKYVSITKTWDTRGHTLTSPKTVNSYRNVYLDDVTVNSLNDHISELKQYYGFSEKSFLFGFDKPKSSNALETMKNKICKQAGVKQIRIHDFRHSHVALLINNGIDSFQGAKRLGHTEMEFSSTYAHMYKDKQVKIADQLNTIISGQEPEK